MAKGIEGKIELTAYDDLFETDESRAEAALSKIRDIPILEIDEFPDHPFKVLMDEGVEEPLKITFVYKTGIHSNLNAKDLSQSVKTLRLYIRTQNCVPIQVTRSENCVHLVALTHTEAVIKLER